MAADSRVCLALLLSKTWEKLFIKACLLDLSRAKGLYRKCMLLILGLVFPLIKVFSAFPQPSEEGVVHQRLRLQQSASAITTTGSLPLTSHRLALLMLRIPGISNEDVILGLTKAQIAAEQARWGFVDRVLKSAQEKDMYTLNPKRQAFLFEWRRLIHERPQLAQSALMDIFLRPDADWSFVTREREWDDQYNAIVDVFLFAREEIEGKPPETIAHELAPVMKQHLNIAVSKAPIKLFFNLKLPSSGYDSHTRAIRFQERGRFEFAKSTDILDLVEKPVFQAPPADTRDLTMVFPTTAHSFMLYQLISSNYSLDLTERRRPQPGVNIGGTLPTESWRQAFPPPSSSNHTIPNIGAIALDRQLRISSIPMAPEVAANFLNALDDWKQPDARVYITAGHVEIGVNPTNVTPGAIRITQV